MYNGYKGLFGPSGQVKSSVAVCGNTRSCNQL